MGKGKEMKYTEVNKEEKKTPKSKRKSNNKETPTKAKKRILGRRSSNTVVKSKDVNENGFDENVQYEVEKIMDERKVKGVLEYKIRWKGFSSKDDTWEEVSKLRCDKLIEQFKESRKTKETPGKAVKRRASSVHEEKAQKIEPKRLKRSSSGKKDDVYEVEKLLELRFKTDGTVAALVRWKGFSKGDDTLEPLENLTCPELIREFLEKVKNKINAKLEQCQQIKQEENGFSELQ